MTEKSINIIGSFVFVGLLMAVGLALASVISWTVVFIIWLLCFGISWGLAEALDG